MVLLNGVHIVVTSFSCSSRTSTVLLGVLRQPGAFLQGHAPALFKRRAAWSEGVPLGPCRGLQGTNSLFMHYKGRGYAPA